MMYLNGEIAEVYLGGHFHSEVYLGSVLVWQNVKKITGEAHAQLAFENTADGVAVVLLPGNAAEALAMTANVTAEAHGMADGSAEELLTLLTAAESTAAGTSNGTALENLLLQYTALGKDIIVNKRQIEEQLNIATPMPLAAALGLVPAGTLGDGLTMETTIPPAVALVLLPIETGDELTLTTPVPPAVAATLVDDEASLALQLVQTASTGDAVLFADGQVNGGEVIAATAEGAVADGAEGAAASEIAVGSAIQPETLTMADGQSAGQLAVETQTQPEVLTLAETLVSAGLTLEHKAVGTAYLPWEYPVLSNGALSITQAWNVVYAKNQHILEVV